MHPGVYIKEEMEARGWLQRDLAFILGCKEQALNPILSGKRGISPVTAKALADAFDVPAEFFLNLQKAHELSLAQEPNPGVALRARMQNQYPVREMIKRGWIEGADALLLESQLVRFFEVTRSDEIPYMPHAAKKSRYEERDIPAPQLAWLFRVRQISKAVSVPKYSEKSLREALVHMKDLMLAPEDVRHVPGILMGCGVRYVIVEKLPNAAIDGVCFWLDGEPVIGMSTRRDSIDNFWFVLRHEVEHVLRRHGQDAEIIDMDLGGSETSDSAPDEEEQVANAAATDFCAPREKLDSFMQRKHPFYYEKDVIAFARILGRHPGIVVGQMQRRMNNYAYLTRHLAKIRQFVISGAIVDGWGQVVPVSI
ncbi:MAG: helix-turn-helix domain-containing protein [Bryobacterales bacterium]|nr:helix-turn-helix domain-containing protein [Bryobacterales bacterium]